MDQLDDKKAKTYLDVVAAFVLRHVAQQLLRALLLVAGRAVEQQNALAHLDVELIHVALRLVGQQHVKLRHVALLFVALDSLVVLYVHILHDESCVALRQLEEDVVEPSHDMIEAIDAGFHAPDLIVLVHAVVGKMAPKDAGAVAEIVDPIGAGVADSPADRNVVVAGEIVAAWFLSVADEFRRVSKFVVQMGEMAPPGAADFVAMLENMAFDTDEFPLKEAEIVAFLCGLKLQVFSKNAHLALHHKFADVVPFVPPESDAVADIHQ